MGRITNTTCGSINVILHFAKQILVSITRSVFFSMVNVEVSSYEHFRRSIFIGCPKSTLITKMKLFPLRYFYCQSFKHHFYQNIIMTKYFIICSLRKGNFDEFFLVHLAHCILGKFCKNGHQRWKRITWHQVLGPAAKLKQKLQDRFKTCFKTCGTNRCCFSLRFKKGAKNGTNIYFLKV